MLSCARRGRLRRRRCRLVFFDAPLEYSSTSADSSIGSSLFFNQKIFYFHVAHAFMLFVAVVVAGVCSIVYLVKRNPKWDDIASAVDRRRGRVRRGRAADRIDLGEGRVGRVVEVGAAADDVAAAVADPRRLRARAPSSPARARDRVAAGMAIFGMVGVPFIYTMVGQRFASRRPAANGVVATLAAGDAARVLARASRRSCAGSWRS